MSGTLRTATPSESSVQAPDGKELRCLVFRDGQAHRPPERLTDLSEILSEDHAIVWLDAVDPRPDDLALIQSEFGLHPLAVEDAISAHERPKIDEYGSYWFLVVHAATTDDSGLSLHEIALFTGKQFIVTVRHSPAYPLDEIEGRWRAHPEALRRDSGFLLYVILDTIVDGYFPVLEALQESIDDLEAALFQRQPFGNDVLMRIFEMKRNIQEFRRAVLPMRDILNPILRGDLDLFPQEEMAYFRDVYDHAVRVIDQLDAVRDLVGSALEIHLSVVANRQNEVSKQLTVIATIFLPLTFITGFFGQNFGVLVGHITGGGAFWFLGIGSEVVTLIIMLIFFKYKRWF